MRFPHALAAAGVLWLVAGSALATETTPAAERQRAAEALSKRAEAGDRDAMTALVPLLHAPDSKVQYHANWGLVRAGEPALPLLLAEYRRLGDDEARVRVVRVIAGMGLAARAARPEMRRELAHPDSAVAGAAAAALGAMRAREALPELVAAYVTARRTSSQRQMIRAMRRIGSDQAERQAKEQLVEAVRRELEDPRRAVLPYAVGLYRTARDDGAYEFPTREELRPLIPGLLEALEDPDLEIALEAMRGLTLAGVDAAPAASSFERMLTEKTTEHAARKALEAIDTPQAREMLARHAALAVLERRVRTEYVPADHLSRTRLLPFWVVGGAEDGVRLEARFLTPGREPRRPERVVFSFESYSGELRLEGVDEVEWIADGVRVRMAGVDHSRSRTQLGVMERLSGAVSVEDFLALANARRLEIHVGAMRLAVPSAERTALRHFAGKIPPAGSSAPAAAAP